MGETIQRLLPAKSKGSGLIDALAVRYWDSNSDGSYGGTNEGAHYYCQDANFNVTAVANSSGTVLERYNYTPYGEVTFLEPDFDARSPQASTIGNTHLYTGRERDPETGLQLNRHRYYAGHLGRWLTRDPIGYRGSARQGQDSIEVASTSRSIGVFSLAGNSLGMSRTIADLEGRSDILPEHVSEAVNYRMLDRQFWS